MSDRNRIAMRQKAGSDVAGLLNHNPRPLRRDHARENVRALRAKAREIRDQRERESAASPQVFKLRQFENIPSRFQEAARRQVGTLGIEDQAWEPLPGAPLGFDDSLLQTPARERAPREQAFLSGLATPPKATPPRVTRSSSVPNCGVAFGSRVPNTPQARKVCGETACTSTPPRATSRGSLISVGASSAAAHTASGALRNGSRSGAAAQRASSAPRSVSRGTPVSQASDFGSPVVAQGDEDYLDVDEFERVANQLKRNRGHGRRPSARDLEFRPERRPIGSFAKAELGNKEDDWHVPEAGVEQSVQLSIPQGYRLIPDHERCETLQILRQKLAELDAQYSRLPLTLETEGQRQQQKSLCDKIRETESAVKVFSRTNVLVEI